MSKRRWAKGITDIKLVTDLGNTPASVDRDTGVVYINNKMRSRISADEWHFILLHELGHLILQSSDEKEVDAWAFDQYAKRGGKLSKSVYALTNVLNFTSPEHLERANLQLRRAQLFDKSQNQLSHAKKKKKINGRYQQKNRSSQKRVPICQKRQGSGSQGQKISGVMERALSNYSISPGGDMHFNGQESFLGLDFGEGFGDRLTKTFNDIESIAESTGNTIKAFKNPSSGQVYSQPAIISGNGVVIPGADNPPSKKKDNTLVYFSIGAGVLVLIFVALVLFKR